MILSEELNNWTNLWDEAVKKEKINQIKSILDANDLNFFFTKEGELFAGPEESRVVFARMKNPDKETPKGWLTTAGFAAINLNKSLENGLTQTMLNHKDLDSIKVVDQDTICDLFAKKIGNKSNWQFVLKNTFKKSTTNDPSNMTPIGDER